MPGSCFSDFTAKKIMARVKLSEHNEKLITLVEFVFVFEYLCAYQRSWMRQQLKDILLLLFVT